MQKKNSTSSIVEAGIIAGIVIVLMLMNAYMPFLSIIGVAIFPIPLTLLVIRHNTGVAIGSLVASAIVGSMLIDPYNAISILVLFGPIGIILGYCIKTKKSSLYPVILQGIAAIIGYVILITITAYIMFDTNIVGLINMSIENIKKSAQMAVDMYTAMGISMENKTMINSINSLTAEIMLMNIVPLLVILGFIVGYANYMITRQILKKFRIEIQPFKSFRNWYVDNRIIALLIILACIGILITNINQNIGQFIIISTLMLLSTILMIIGMSTAIYYLNKFQVFKSFGVIFIILTMVSLQYVYVILGLTESIMDTRNLDPNSIKKALMKKITKK